MNSKGIILVCLMGLLSSMGFAVDTFSVGKIQKISARVDGNYNISCENALQEVATDLDIRLNNVCPVVSSVPSLNFQSVEGIGEGTFAVVCTDGSHKVVTKEQMTSGEVCPPLPESYSVVAGNYAPKTRDRYFCKRYNVNQVVTDENQQIKSFGLKCRFAGNWNFLCEKGRCTSGEGRTITLQSNVKNTFKYESEGNVTTLLLMSTR